MFIVIALGICFVIMTGGVICRSDPLRPLRRLLRRISAQTQFRLRCRGLAGVFLASGFGAGHPLEGIGWELSAIASVEVGGTFLTGGMGSIPVTMAGALPLVFNVPNFENGQGTISFSAHWQMVVRGGFLFAVILLKSRVIARQQKVLGL